MSQGLKLTPDQDLQMAEKGYDMADATITNMVKEMDTVDLKPLKLVTNSLLLNKTNDFVSGLTSALKGKNTIKQIAQQKMGG